MAEDRDDSDFIRRALLEKVGSYITDFKFVAIFMEDDEGDCLGWQAFKLLRLLIWFALVNDDGLHGLNGLVYYFIDIGFALNGG